MWHALKVTSSEKLENLQVERVRRNGCKPHLKVSIGVRRPQKMSHYGQHARAKM